MSETNTTSVNAEIIAIGTELLLGEITDTNSVYLARRLRDLGINLYFMTSVGDNEARIEAAIRRALERAQVVITCGGLGPTVDDMTRQAVAAATERTLEFHPHLMEAIAARFTTYRTTMTANNERQAYVPRGALIIDNPVGTAPSFIVEEGDTCVVSLPGVPREMKFLFEERVIPYLREHYRLGGTIIKARVLKTAGIGESVLDQQIGDALLTAANPTVGLAAHSGQVDVRITAKASTELEADGMITEVERAIRLRIGRYIYGVDAETMDEALAAALRRVGVSLVIYEAGVSPVLAERSAFLERAGANVTVRQVEDAETLRVELGLPQTAGARDLAEEAARRSGSVDESLVVIAAVSGANDTTDRADSAERSALAVCYGNELRSRTYGFGGRADEVRQHLVNWAWAMAWRLLGDVTQA